MNKHIEDYMKPKTDQNVFHKFKVQVWRRAVPLDAYDVNLSNGRMPYGDPTTISATDAYTAAKLCALGHRMHWTEWEEGSSPPFVIRVEQVES